MMHWALFSSLFLHVYVIVIVINIILFWTGLSLSFPSSQTPDYMPPLKLWLFLLKTFFSPLHRHLVFPQDDCTEVKSIFMNFESVIYIGINFII